MEFAQWSFLVAGIPAAGLLVAGRHRKIGWLICIAGQLVQVGYGVLTSQWGLVAWAPIYIAIYGCNWLLWSRREDRDERSAVPASAG